MKRIVSLSAIAAGILVSAPIFAATPAYAAGSFTDNANGTVTLTYSNANPSYGWIVCTGVTSGSSCTMSSPGAIGFTQSTGMFPPGSSPVTIGVGANYYSWVTQAPATLAAGSYTFAYWDNGNMNVAVASIANVSIGTAPPSDDSAPVSGGSGPAPVVQQFGKPSVGTCDEAQPPGLNWGAVPSGGWGVTWAHWMNDYAGGFVCSRTLVYSNSLGGWSVE